MGNVVEQVAFQPSSGPTHPLLCHYVDAETGTCLRWSGMPGAVSPQPLGDRAVEVQLVWLGNAAQHRFPCLWYRHLDAPDGTKNGPRTTLLHCHGNAESVVDRGNQAILYKHAVELGVDVFSFEYSGYEGTRDLRTGATPVPTEKLCYANAEAAYEFLTRDQGLPPRQVVVYGRSLGSGVAVEFALRHPEIRGCVLQSPILSAARVALPTSIPGLDIFQNVWKVGRVCVPTFVLHGTADEVVAFEHGEKLFSRLTTCPLRRRWWIEGAGHNDVERNFGRGLRDELRAFLQSLSDRPPSHGEAPFKKSSFQRVLDSTWNPSSFRSAPFSE